MGLYLVDNGVFPSQILDVIVRCNVVLNDTGDDRTNMGESFRNNDQFRLYFIELQQDERLRMVLTDKHIVHLSGQTGNRRYELGARRVSAWRTVRLTRIVFTKKSSSGPVSRRCARRSMLINAKHNVPNITPKRSIL
mgnify:CR=1 FL=1